jgi:DNA replication protein DnaC
MDSIAEKIAAIAKRCQERAEDPAFKANAEAQPWAVSPLTDEEKRLADEVARNNRLLRTGVPVGHWKTIENPKPTASLDAVRTHLSAPRECVFVTLAGPRGRGKTLAAEWAAVEGSGRYVVAQELVRLSQFDPEWADLEREPVLAIDELGAEYLNDAYRANLYALLDARYAHQRKTVLVTNLDASAFRSRYCPDPQDRLFERMKLAGEWVNLAGESMRVHWSEGDHD